MKRKEAVIILLIYITGCVVSYPLGKRAMTEAKGGKYTVGTRSAVLVLCTLSWAHVLGAGLYLLSKTEIKDNKEPANW